MRLSECFLETSTPTELPRGFFYSKKALIRWTAIKDVTLQGFYCLLRLDACRSYGDCVKGVLSSLTR